MKPLFHLLAFCLLSGGVFAQKFNLTGQKSSRQQSDLVDQSMREYSIQSFPVNALFDFLEQHPGNFQLDINLDGEKTLTVELQPSAIVAEDCQLRVAESNGQIRSIEQPAIYTWKGRVVGETSSAVAITVARNFLYVFVENGDLTRFIEPAAPFDKNLGEGKYLVYEGRNVVENPNLGCGLIELEHHHEVLEQGHQDSDSEVDACSKLVELAVASDYSMVTRYGTFTDVINHNVALINASEVNYSSSFSSVILFSIVSQFVSACAECDPWSTSGDPNILFNSFLAWGNAGGFGPGVTFDLAHLRSTRSLTSNGAQVLGASALGGICKNSRYSIFSELASLSFANLRKTTSHEIGHSFGANHSTGIMAQGISTSNTWSNTSITEINAGIATAACINTSNCAAVPPANPDGLRYFCSWGAPCVNYNSNPCNQTYTVTSNDPDLVITVDGTTICLRSLTPGPRVSTLQVTAINFCGVASTESATWNVQIDPLLYCPQSRPATPAGDVAENFQFSMRDGFLTLLDQTPEPRTKTVQVFDLSGKLLLEQTCDTDLNSISLSGLPTGILMARVMHGKEVVTTKFYHW